MPVGPIETWPHALQSTLSGLLNATFLVARGPNPIGFDTAAERPIRGIEP
ncbi:hypothetical protein MKK88_15975 [Methylobacterium sp. E-005]|nr:hypothetical protein [Methylobacterium sp. E-005]MCJ2087469.1 hypothetical protein [Methylobacterium sp. E-005]